MLQVLEELVDLGQRVYNMVELNQYELVLAMTNFIRLNPGHPVNSKLKQCKTQLEQMQIFQKEVKSYLAYNLGS